MAKFTTKQIVDYYDKTKIHYQRAWDLNESLAMHYGYTDDKIRAFRPSLANMNKQLAVFGKITKKDYVLDAGCGVGGSSIYLAKEIGCRVKGITLPMDQVEHATKNAKEKGVDKMVSFEQANYTKTPFKAETFDVIWGMESIVHEEDKVKFLKEAHRILKPKGRVILAEYIKADKNLKPKEQQILDKWLHPWAIENIVTIKDFEKAANIVGFESFQAKEVTANIRKSAWRMFYGSFFLRVLSSLYRIYNPKVSYFADNHYKGLYYQYPALRKGLWKYYFIELVK